ncbi:MAG: polyphosphate kinase 2 family protein [Acidimicrobiia bacterium]|nr:polyphosphate kinase 2 family protein [Acidimicrobiia bacterium]
MHRYRVEPGQAAQIAARDTRDSQGFTGDKSAGKARIKELNAELEALQELLYAEGKHKVLIVLQAMDTGGKDGTIRHVFDGTNPQGVKVASFKKPTASELAHDYLWRVHDDTPGSGEIAIFNRSHYEDVLVVRVHSLVPEDRWRRRYDHINAFEQLLADEGTTILKFFLHISKDEQKARLEARIDEPHKRWKFAKGDLAERERWGDYVEAYEEALTRTSTEWAPWYVIPADRKWYRNLATSSIIVDALQRLGMEYPDPEDGLDDIVIE